MAEVTIEQAMTLAIQHHQAGRLLEAEQLYRKILDRQPENFKAVHYLGLIAHQAGRNEIAVGLIRQAIALNPNYAEAHSNLGVALRDTGQFDEAIAACRRAIALEPNYAKAHNNLGNALIDKGQLDEAIVACRRAIALEPNLPEIHSNLGVALRARGQFDEAIVAYRTAVHLKPSFHKGHSNLIFSLYLDPKSDVKVIHDELLRWNRLHAEPLKKFIQPHPNDRTSDRRLRIGYVSPDFRHHPVGHNFLPLLETHDHLKFEIFCYSMVARPDDLTQHMQTAADAWRIILSVSDEQVAEMIRKDQIDILVDLTLHTEGNRLLVFARKPAPVQVAFMGYPGSTGLDAMDYRLTDPYLDPPGLNDAYYSEESLRLPNTFWCYNPLASESRVPAPGINTLPALTNGYVTFGCLNNFCKINDGVLELWAKVLTAVPHSRLMLLVPMGQARQWIFEKLQTYGMEAGRVEFMERKPRADYLKSYHHIDLGLDTLPYNGHTTSLDSFWMGIPVVTLMGQTVVGRAGCSLLCNLGLKELVAQTPEQYVEIAVKLAGNLPRLSELRTTLRQRMRASPLMDATRFAQNVESAYRTMWRKWCENK
jgi:protein O-GlcNAc transferase